MSCWHVPGLPSFLTEFFFYLYDQPDRVNELQVADLVIDGVGVFFFFCPLATRLDNDADEAEFGIAEQKENKKRNSRLIHGCKSGPARALTRQTYDAARVE